LGVIDMTGEIFVVARCDSQGASLPDAAFALAARLSEIVDGWQAARKMRI